MATAGVPIYFISSYGQIGYGLAGWLTVAIEQIIFAATNALYIV